MNVRRELEQTADRQVTVGTVYGTLDRLEAKGYVRSWHTDPEPVRGGRARRYFEVEPEGELALARARDMIAKMWDGVELVTKRDAAGAAHGVRGLTTRKALGAPSSRRHAKRRAGVRQRSNRTVAHCSRRR